LFLCLLHFVLNLQPEAVELQFHCFHFGVDSIRELFEFFGSFLRLLVHFFLKNEGSLHLMQKDLLFGNLIVLSFPFLLLVLEVLGLDHIGSHLLLDLEQLVMLPTL
jgi:hypothetical protein